MKNPFLSVLIPVYDTAQYVEACLDSVLSQDYDKFEVIAVDDGSSEILDRKAESDPRLKVIHKPENEGISLARKTAVEASQGDYVIFVDSDDTVRPGCFAAAAAEIEQGGYDIVAFDYVMTYANGRPDRTMRYRQPEAVQQGYDYLKDIYTFRMNTMLNIYVIRRRLWENISYPRKFWTFEDTYIQAQIALQCPKVKHLPFVAYNYLQRPSSISHQLPSAEYIADWCGEMRKLIFSAEGLSAEDKELYALLCDFQNYYVYVSHSRNPWRGNLEFVVRLREGLEKRIDDVSRFYDAFHIRCVRLDACRWLRPYVKLLLLSRRWRRSINKRINKSATV